MSESARTHLRQAAGLGDEVDLDVLIGLAGDEALSARLVATAERTLAALPVDRRGDRARLLVTIAVERRADSGPRGAQTAREAEVIARELGDPTVLAFALNGRFLQTFHRAGLAPDRGRIGVELLELARANGLVVFEVLAHLIGIQSSAAVGDLTTADRHAAAADEIAGAGSGLVAFGPVAQHLGDIEVALGRNREADAHYRHALAVAERVGAPHWAAAAREALEHERERA